MGNADITDKAFKSRVSLGLGRMLILIIKKKYSMVKLAENEDTN